LVELLSLPPCLAQSWRNSPCCVLAAGSLRLALQFVDLTSIPKPLYLDASLK
jgi:hypothetical protein